MSGDVGGTSDARERESDDVDGGDGGADADAREPAAGTVGGRARAVAPLSEDARRALVEQLEFYFGDANVVTDEWLRERIVNAEDGWVSLEEVCAFPRMRSKLKRRSWKEVVPGAIREIGSRVIEVSEDGERVRRLEPVPEFDAEEIERRTVVAENCAEWSVAALRKIFETCGEVTNVRMRKPGHDGIPATENRGKVHALVEFATIEQANEAAARLDNPTDWRNGIRVRVLLKPGQKKKQNKKKQAQKVAVDAERTKQSEGQEQEEENAVPATKKASKKKAKPDYAKWASAAAFKENRTSITSQIDVENAGEVELEAVEASIPKKLVLTQRAQTVDARPQPTMPDGSPGFTRKRTCAPKFAAPITSETNGAED